MKKVILAIPLLLLAFTKLSAQDEQQPIVRVVETDEARTVETTYENRNVLTNDFKYNWELIAALGTQFYYGENEKYIGFWERFTFPAADLMLTKWASPCFGFTVGITGLKMKGAYQVYPDGSAVQANPPHFMTDELYKVSGSSTHDLNYQRGWYLNPFVAATFDLSNIFGNTRTDRIYALQAYAGGGVMLGIAGDGKQLSNARGVSFNAGLVNRFRLSETLDFIVNLRGALVTDSFDGESRSNEPFEESFITGNVPFDGVAGITAGLCMHFGAKKSLSNWNYANNVTTDHYIHPDIIVEKEIVHDTVTVGCPVNPELWFHIQFKIDKTDIQPRERINVNSVADFIKSAPDTKFLVAGFADKQTSYPEHNMWLSEHRAKNVYNMLVNEFGVNPDQLEIDYRGGVDYMFYAKEELSRCVMIIPLVGKNIDEFGERTLPKDGMVK